MAWKSVIFDHLCHHCGGSDDPVCPVAVICCVVDHCPAGYRFHNWHIVHVLIVKGVIGENQRDACAPCAVGTKPSHDERGMGMDEV